MKPVAITQLAKVELTFKEEEKRAKSDNQKKERRQPGKWDKKEDEFRIQFAPNYRLSARALAFALLEFEWRQKEVMPEREWIGRRSSSVASSEATIILKKVLVLTLTLKY